MRSDELALLCGVTPQAVRAKTKEASSVGALYVEFGGVRYGFRLVRGESEGGAEAPLPKKRGRSRYEYEAFEAEKTVELALERKEVSLKDEQKEELDIRLRIVHSFFEWQRKKRGTVGAFVEWVVLEFNIHYTQKIHFDRMRAYKERGAFALLDKRGREKKRSYALDEEQKKFLVSMFRAFGAGQTNFKQIWEELHRWEADRRGFKFTDWKLNRVANVCDYGVVKRFIENYYEKRVMEYTLIVHGEDANKSYNQVAYGSRREQWTRKNQCWEVDSSPADVIIYEDGRQMRPDILAVRDAYSGRCVAMLAEKSNTLSIIRLLWRAIDAFGMPEFIKGDNGRDYTSKQFQGLLEHLGIRYDAAMAYSGDQKGVVERGFRTVQHSSMKVLAGFIGHNVSHRQKIEQQTAKKDRKAKDMYGGNLMTQTPSDELLSFEDFDARLQEAVLLWDMDKKRRSGLSPLELWNACCESVKKISYESFLIYAGGYSKRNVAKDGIHFEGRRFVSSFLPRWHGQDVFVSENIDNVAEIFVFDERGKFLGICDDTKVKPMSKEELLRLKKEQNREIAGLRKEIKGSKVSMRTRTSAKADLARAKEAFEQELQSVSEVVISDVVLEREVKGSRLKNSVRRVMPTLANEELDPFLQYGVG